MPIPYVQECQESMNSVSSAKSDLIALINAVKSYATSDTWSGPPAENFMTDLNGHVTAAVAALGGPLDDAKAECIKHAQKLQADSARAAAKASSGGS